MSAEARAPIPPFSAGATSDRSRLKFEILGIVFAYLAWVLVVAIIAFLRRRKPRRKLWSYFDIFSGPESSEPKLGDFKNALMTLRWSTWVSERLEALVLKVKSKIWRSHHQLKAARNLTVDEAVLERDRAHSLEDLTILYAVADGYRLGLRESLHGQDAAVLSEPLSYPGHINKATLRQPSESYRIHRQQHRTSSSHPRIERPYSVGRTGAQRSSALSGMTLVHDLHDDGNGLPIISDQALETHPLAQPRGIQVKPQQSEQITGPIPSFRERSYHSCQRQVRFSLPSPMSMSHENSPRQSSSEEVLQQPNSALLPGSWHSIACEHVDDNDAEISPLHSTHHDNKCSPYNQSAYSNQSEFKFVALQLPSSLYTSSTPMSPVFPSHFGSKGASEPEVLENYGMVNDDDQIWGAVN